MMDAGAVIQYVGIVGLYAKVIDGVGKNVQRPMKTVCLHGILSAAGQNEGDHFAIHPGNHACAERADHYFFRFFVPHNLEFYRFIRFETEERSHLCLIQRTLAAGPYGVIRHGGNVGRMQLGLLSVEGYLIVFELWRILRE